MKNSLDLTAAAVAHSKSASCPINYDVDKLISDYSRPALRPQLGIAEFPHGQANQQARMQCRSGRLRQGQVPTQRIIIDDMLQR